IDHRADLVGVAPIGVDDPDVSVFHCSLEVSEPAFGCLINESLAVGRPSRSILGALRRCQTPNRSVDDLQREEIVVEKLVLVLLTIRDESYLFTGWGPID